MTYCPVEVRLARDDDAAQDAACGAACGLVVRDVITTEDYDILTRAWRTVIGPIHPEDEFWAAVAKAAK